QAANLESAIKDARHDELDALLAELAQSLAELIAAITALWPPQQAAEPGVADQAQVAQLCQQLQQLFASDDPRAGKIFDAQAELLRSAFNKNYAALAAAVHRYDFEQAQALLQTAASELLRGEG
ncbi:MAG TPA: hypothetical protein VFY62_04890, partial [Pseudomonas sp.]|nr:hypothetical protein [Pseudomonas sp.]